MIDGRPTRIDQLATREKVMQRRIDLAHERITALEELLLLTSPNGKRWKITVDDSGVLTTTEVV